MRRVIVMGGAGFFGRNIVTLLRERGIDVVVASRHAGGDVRIDVEDATALRALLKRRDVVVDAAGPFQGRTPALLDAAIAAGCDVVDLSDSLAYTKFVYARAMAISQAGIAVLTSCSSVSAVLAAMITVSRISHPTRLRGFIRPASRETSHAATVRAFLASIGRPIETFEDGRPRSAIGWRRRRRFPGSAARSGLVESAAALTLPRAWWSLRTVEVYVDPNLPPALAMGLDVAAYLPPLQEAATRMLPAVLAAGKLLGSPRGAFAVEVEGANGAAFTRILSASRGSYLVAVLPAVLAASALAGDRFAESGVVRADRQVDPDELFTELRRSGIASRSGPT
ncbi:MAG: saccharopine dehydrogenase NADP-binding domain-containing protein [Chloroflexota bacterium]|nr:saccharopine dehydrogenase NADP-binding domain-containing protein [Chloroflexota bacterium]